QLRSKSRIAKMRIAVSGAHRTGKTTLVAELQRNLPAYEAVDEPYRLLEDEGYEFAEMPSLEDFERQLERSIESVAPAAPDRNHDRCPADIVGYLTTHVDAAAFDLEDWFPRVRDAMQALDLVVFVPIELPDRVAVSAADHMELRRRVDDELRDILLDDRWGLGVQTLEVAGTVAERARQVLARIRPESHSDPWMPEKA